MKLGKLVLFGGVAALVGCVPPSTGGGPAPTTAPPPTTTAAPGDPHTPQIASFTASRSSGPSPLTTALRWSISDPDGNPLTCALDLDGDGSFETNVGPCSSATSRTRTFTSSATVGLKVTDGTNVATATLPLTVGAPTADDFDITVRFVGTMTEAQEAAFSAAAAKWSSTIRTDQPDIPLEIDPGEFMAGAPAFVGTVDDILIDAQVKTMDGAGGTLGSAGWIYARNSNGLPVYGIMNFDEADMATMENNGTLADVIVHEMGHVLGIGTSWAWPYIVGGPYLTGAGSADPRFVGPAATGVWNEMGGVGHVPVENTGSSGTRDSHWRESTFDTELMTGWLDMSSRLSRLSVASLADLGYGVDLAGADPYSLPGLMAMWRIAGLADGDPVHLHTDPVTPRGGV